MWAWGEVRRCDELSPADEAHAIAGLCALPVSIAPIKLASMDLPEPLSAMKAMLDAMPGAVAEPMTAARGSRPLVLVYKIMGKMFAILSFRAEQFVILKCDSFRTDLLR